MPEMLRIAEGRSASVGVWTTTTGPIAKWRAREDSAHEVNLGWDPQYWAGSLSSGWIGEFKWCHWHHLYWATSSNIIWLNWKTIKLKTRIAAVQKFNFPSLKSRWSGEPFASSLLNHEMPVFRLRIVQQIVSCWLKPSGMPWSFLSLCFREFARPTHRHVYICWPWSWSPKSCDR